MEERTQKVEKKKKAKKVKTSTYIYFVDNKTYYTREKIFTGAQITARISGYEPGCQLVLENKHDRPDLVVSLDMEVNLEKESPCHFYTVNQATWG